MVMVLPLSTWTTEIREDGEDMREDIAVMELCRDNDDTIFLQMLEVQTKQMNSSFTGRWKEDQRRVNLLSVLHPCLMIHGI